VFCQPIAPGAASCGAAKREPAPRGPAAPLRGSLGFEEPAKLASPVTDLELHPTAVLVVVMPPAMPVVVVMMHHHHRASGNSGEAQRGYDRQSSNSLEHFILH